MLLTAKLFEILAKQKGYGFISETCVLDLYIFP